MKILDSCIRRPDRYLGTLVMANCNMRVYLDVSGDGVVMSVAGYVLVQITAQTTADRDAHT